MLRSLAYWLMAVCLAAAVFLQGGVDPRQWEWVALGISCAALAAVFSADAPEENRTLVLLGLLLAWMVLQLVPLPPIVVHALSPERWDAVIAARAATSQSSRGWFALSAAPAATMERLLQVFPVMAAFLAAREIGRWRANRLWTAIAPVLFIAWMESIIALLTSRKSGTYVNHNHFAGLLEMALPLASAWAISVWISWKTRYTPPIWGVVCLGIGACLWTALLMSLSRMGVFSALAALLVTTAIMLFSVQRDKRRWRIAGVRFTWWRVAAISMFFLVFVPTRAMVRRFADVDSTEDQSASIRVKIWEDTAQVIAAYKWTGCGLGAYEQGLYRHRTVEPASTVDFAHNDYLQILAELGLIGSVLLGALVVRIVRGTLRTALNSGAVNWTVALGLLGSFVALGLHSITDFNLYIPANALALAWLAGVADSPGITKA
jgi:O-antigen ligase